MNKIQMTAVNDDHYIGADGCVMKREYGDTPNGNKFYGRWVLRTQAGEIVDFDVYGNDLAERNNLELF